MLEGLGMVWDKATFEERHKLLAGMLDAVYIDLWVSRSIIGLQPKPSILSSLRVFETPPRQQGHHLPGG